MKQPGEPWARIQPPVRARRRGRPQNPPGEPSPFEIVAARVRNQAGDRGRNVGEMGRGQGHG